MKDKQSNQVLEVLISYCDRISRIPFSSLKESGDKAVSLIFSFLKYQVTALLIEDYHKRPELLASRGIGGDALTAWTDQEIFIRYVWNKIKAATIFDENTVDKDIIESARRLGMDGTILIVPFNSIAEYGEYRSGLVIAAKHQRDNNRKADLAAMETLAGQVSDTMTNYMVMSRLLEINEAIKLDVGEFQQVEEELKAFEEKYYSMAEKVFDAICIVQDHIFKFVNAKMLNLTKFSEKELIGMSIKEVFSRNASELMQERYDKIISGELPKFYIAEIVDKKGDKFSVEVNVELINYRGRMAKLIFLKNISKRKRTEDKLKRCSAEIKATNQKLRNTLERMNKTSKENEKSREQLTEAQSQLVQSEKLAGIGILASGVAHEINNPLQGVFSKVNRILRKINDEKVVRDSAEKIRKYAEKMAEIVKELSKYSRDAGNESESTVDLNTVLEESLKMASFSRNFSRITIRKKWEDIPLVIGNAGQMQQIFINLITNALDAMDEKGTLTLRTGISPVPELETAPHRRRKEDNMIWAEVSDNGCGINEEDLEHIFKPLFTTKDPGKGTGLGLSVASQLIGKLKGRIKVVSSPEKGTTFRISFGPR